MITECQQKVERLGNDILDIEELDKRIKLQNRTIKKQLLKNILDEVRFELNLPDGNKYMEEYAERIFELFEKEQK